MASYKLIDALVQDGEKYYGPAATLQNGLSYSHLEEQGLEYGGDVVDDKLVSKAALKHMLVNSQAVAVGASVVAVGASVVAAAPVAKDK